MFRYGWNFRKNWTKWQNWEDSTTVPASLFQNEDNFWGDSILRSNVRL